MPLLLLSKPKPLRWASIWIHLTETADSVSPLAPRRSKLYIACSDFLCLWQKSQSALMPLLLLSKSKPLRWASVWYLVRASGQHIVRSDFFCKAHLSLILPRLCPDPKGRTSALLFGRAIFMSIAKRRSALRPANKRSLKLKPAGAVRRLPVFCCCAYRGIGQPRSSSLTLQEKTIRTGASLRETGSDLFLFRAALNFCLRCFCYGRP